MSEILIEFIPDFTKLEAGVDALVSNNTISKEMAALFTDAGKSLDQFGAKFAKLGGGTTLKPAIDAAKKSISDLSKSGITDLGELKKRVDGITKSFIDGFGEGVEQALKDAGVSMEQFTNTVKKNADVDKSLKSELRSINEELTRMKLNGQGNTQQYQELSKRAGEYRDAIQDVNEEINRQASDTQKLDVAIRFVTQLSSAYSVLQGIQGLVGQDNEELQKTLLKVNSAMAILNGLQQIQNELSRQDNIVTIAQTKVQAAYNFVVRQTSILFGAGATAAQRFRAAMTLTGIGALITAIGLLVANLDKLKNAFSPAVNEAEKLEAITRKQYDASLLAVEGFDLEERKLRALGVAEDEIREKKRQRIVLTLKAADAELKALDAVLSATVESSAKGAAAAAGNPLLGLFFKDLEDVKKVQDTVKEIKTKREELEVEILELNKEDVDERKKEIDDLNKKRKEGADKAAKDREDRLQKEAEARRKALEDEVAFQKQRLLIAKEGTQEELNAKKGIAQAELNLALDNDKLTFNQRRLLIQEFFKSQRELTDQFNSANKKKVLEDQASVISAQLAALNLSFDERERLTVEQLEIERQLQLSAVTNNKTKEKEINAKFDKEIADQRKQIREQAFAEELDTIRRNAFIAQQIAQDTAADDSLPNQQRMAALKEIYDFEFSLITQSRLNNQQLLKDNIISFEEYTKRSKDLSNQEFQLRTKNEKDFTGIIQKEEDERRRKRDETIDFIVAQVNSVITAFRTFTDSMNSNEDARIESQRDSLQRLRELGVIQEKEFIARTKVIDRLERQAKQKQAEREKAIALFEAFVNGAAAIVKASDNPFQLAATIALVTAQIAAIASRKIPQFGKGTKSAPKGFAEVGETGTELIQMNGKYFVADHPQVIWMKGGERVYNPEETKDILTPQANMTVINNTNGYSKESKVDYDRMAKKIGEEIARHPRSVISLDEDGFSVHISNKLNTQKYLNKRFTFND